MPSFAQLPTFTMAPFPHMPIFNVAKRKFTDDLPMLCKKTKLHHNPMPTPPSSPITLALRQKRKRADEPETNISREPKARRIGGMTHPRSKWSWEAFDRLPKEQKGPALSRHWDQLTPRPLIAPLSPMPASRRIPILRQTKNEKEQKKLDNLKNIAAGVASKAARVPRPARPTNQRVSPANSPRKKEASQQVNQHKAKQVERKGKRAKPVSTLDLLNLVSNYPLSWEEDVIR